MKKLPTLMIAGVLTCSSLLALAADMSGIIKAQIILGQVTQIMDKYEDIQALISTGEVELIVAEPRADADGEYVFPFTSYDSITEWAEKSLSAQAGAEVGAMAGDKAASALASKVPFGGLAAGMLKGKTKEIAAVTAIGGWEFIRETSDLSFDNLTDYSLYMHTQFSGTPEYETALAAATAIYPELEKGHSRAIDTAYKNARKEAAKKKK